MVNRWLALGIIRLFFNNQTQNQVPRFIYVWNWEPELEARFLNIKNKFIKI
jgi:hypothetical protein